MPVLLDLVLITEVWRLFKEWKENKLCYIFQQGTGGVATLSNCPLKAIKDAVKHSSEMYQQLDPTASHGVMSDLRKSLSSGRRSVLELSSSPCSSDVLRAVTRDNYRDGALSETSEQRSSLEWPGKEMILTITESWIYLTPPSSLLRPLSVSHGKCQPFPHRGFAETERSSTKWSVTRLGENKDWVMRDLCLLLIKSFS